MFMCHVLDEDAGLAVDSCCRGETCGNRCVYLSTQNHGYLAEEQDHDAEGVNLPLGEDRKNTQPIGAQGPASDMIYTIEDVPPWYLCILLGLQVKPSLRWFEGSGPGRTLDAEIVGTGIFCGWFEGFMWTTPVLCPILSSALPDVFQRHYSGTVSSG